MHIEIVAQAAYIVAALLFILSLAGLSKHESSRQGIVFGIGGMTIAVVATIVLAIKGANGTAGLTAGAVGLIAIAMVIGAVLGLLRARSVAMTGMPELIAMLHSFVGLAAVLVGWNGYLEVEAKPDGAAALVLMRESTATRLGSKPIARIVAHSVHAQAPNWFTTAPVGAIEKVLKKAGWNAKDVDLWEVNEAFAAVTMAAMTEFKLAHEIVNVHGGAVALGHPIGASGARIVVTLLGALRQAGKKKGVAALCIGGGEATALAVEMI